MDNNMPNKCSISPNPLILPTQSARNKFLVMLHTNAYAPITLPITISENAKSVLCTLIYFDVFSYPLTAQEIFERSTLTNLQEVNIGIRELVAARAIFCIHGFYCLHNNEFIINKRLAGNAHAAKSLETAKRITHIIKRFPFVRAVMLSGSISKNYMDKDSDIDYFIVTVPNRLWISRMFFVLFQKIIFFNRYKYFCYNYMVDEDHIAITDQTFYTAIEASTLLPVYNFEVYQQFKESNLWTQVFFPNYPTAEEALLKNNQSFTQRMMELFFNNAFGEWLDKYLMKKIEAKWRRRHSPKMFAGSRNLQLKRYTAKAHTESHYNRIMDLYSDKKREYEERYNIQFDKKTHLIAPTKLNA